jgi:putative colanic acid biosynthesis UDP-glucose lipid carrier transferase
MVLYARRTHINQLALLTADVLGIFAVFRVIDYIQRGDWEFIGNYPLFFAVFAMLWWILAGQFASAVPAERLATYAEKFWNLIRTILLHAVVLTIGMLVLQVRLLPMRYLLLLYCMVGATVVSGRLLMALLYRTYRSRFAQTHSRFVVVGASRSGRELHQLLTMHDPLANRCLGFFTDTPAPDDVKSLVRGKLSDLKEFCPTPQPDRFYSGAFQLC